MKFSAVVPIQSVENMKDNFLLLDKKPIFLYIFETLIQTPMIDRVICYCSNELIKDFLPSGVEFLKKDKSLDKDSTYSSDLLKDLAKKVDTDYFIMCSITSPFVKSLSIVKGIEKILYEGFDSSICVEKLNKYAWFLGVPLNNSLQSRQKTNEIEPLFIETKGFCIFEKALALKERYIGYNPALIQVSPIEALNVKNEQDLELARIVAKSLNKEKISPYFLLSKHCEHIILDMDGVLVDSLELMQKAWDESGGSKYASFNEYKRLIGLPFDDICLKLGILKEKIPTIKEKYFNYSQKYVSEISLYEGVKESLESFKKAGLKISVATSKNYEAALNIINHFSLPIDCLIAPNAKDYQGRHKPFGDCLLYACYKNQVNSSSSLYVGDMLSDYQAAKEANIDFIFASYGYGGGGGEASLINAPSIKAFKDLKLLIL